MFERVVLVYIRRFMECSGVLTTAQFAYRKGLGTCDALFCASHSLQGALKSGLEARIVQIDFSTVFDRVNHPRIPISSVLWVLEVLFRLYWHSFYLIDLSTLCMVYGCWSKLVNIVRSSAGRCFGPVIIPPVHLWAFFNSGE